MFTLWGRYTKRTSNTLCLGNNTIFYGIIAKDVLRVVIGMNLNMVMKYDLYIGCGNCEIYM